MVKGPTDGPIRHPHKGKGLEGRDPRGHVKEGQSVPACRSDVFLIVPTWHKSSVGISNYMSSIDISFIVSGDAK
jgi:hypothetical protein